VTVKQSVPELVPDLESILREIEPEGFPHR